MTKNRFFHVVANLALVLTVASTQRWSYTHARARTHRAARAPHIKRLRDEDKRDDSSDVLVRIIISPMFPSRAQAPPCTIDTLLGARIKGTARDATNAPTTLHVANANTTGKVRKHTTYGKQDGCAQLSGHVHRRYNKPTASAVLVLNSGHILRTLLCRKGAAKRLLGGAKGIQ